MTTWAAAAFLMAAVPALAATPSPTPPADGAPAAPGPAWLDRGTAEIAALDKVDDRRADLTIRVGQSATFGPLNIAVQACVVRPPDQPADAAAYLNVTDPHPGAPAFHGWMLSSDPPVSMMEHPIYDVRVVACH
ncbi:DUF2155 domain-containing protein [Acidisphaera rubrifaciens]|uniref:DUF2155 domain-containing protein n=1 Tax=Acidisphaera rubrifaciens HS-AP3 TaxID=1231350 RepID=A0A0D6P546_9PROT|nr:DUF2155 domain-containing protein [Acidisphaera rubrifaciens]GAN76885.1 hypothetical protein Asru_0182_05 [Acidisphaera rubrifaciens HS-AP3]